MNIDKILKRYFDDVEGLPLIEAFDKESIYSVYTDIFTLLVRHADFELSVLQALGYCLYEVLDNVIIHSNKDNGVVLMHYDQAAASIRILIADDGIGIHGSLTENPKYKCITEPQALESCVKDTVSDGKGMGFGLFTLSRLIEKAGIAFEIHSGNNALCFNGVSFHTQTRAKWQGTLVYFNIHTDIEINPMEIVDNRTDPASEFNDTFISNEEEQLW